MKILKNFSYQLIVLILVQSCANKQEPSEQPSSLIEITNRQFATDSMQIGEMDIKIFENIINVNGNIVPLPDGIANINAPVQGFVKSISCKNGQLVNKNQILLEISGNEIIDLQKEFAGTSAQFKRVKADFERAKLLFNEKVTSEKDFISIESEYKSLLAYYTGLKLKIESIGLSIPKIENGEFYSSYPVRSPLNGYVSNLKTNTGSYIDTHSELMEIINPASFQVQLSVFASDISKIKKGQKVRFKPINSGQNYSAIINTVGIAIDNNSKTIDCYASITGDKANNFYANEFIESQVITNIDTVYAVPVEAILKNETVNYILLLVKKEQDKYIFKKEKVTIGRQQNGYTEILGKKVEGSIVIKGIYNLSI